jgi:radical SAM protein with 4Fe4S-binding SPASM domain
MMQKEPFLASNTPSYLQFETNTVCNGKCLFCEHKNMQQREPAKWSSLIDLMYRYVPHVSKVVPHGIQEPFLEPRLTALLTNIKQMNQHAETTIYSNMTVYDEKVMRRLIMHQCLDTLKISFYGVDKKTYSKLQPGFNYEQVQRNIKRFMRLRKRLGWKKPHVQMHLIATPETVPKSRRFFEKWRRIVDSVGWVHYDGWCGKQPYNPVFEQAIWGLPANERYPCNRLWTGMNVHCNGDVVPCCLDAHSENVVGNIYTDKDPFNSPKMQELRRLHLEGKQDQIDMCRNCTVWRYEEPKEWTQFWQTQQQSNVASALTPCTK